MKTEVWQPENYDAPRRRLVPCYDAFYGTVAELVARWGRRQPRVLDLGAGTGLLTAEVAARVELGDVTLMDGSAAMLARAGERLANLRPQLVVADFTAPLPEGPFDVVMSALAIHHLDDAGKRDLYGRVLERLTPGGLFVNAEQVSHADPCGQAIFEATHLEHARRLGCDGAEIDDAVQRMQADQCAPSDVQVSWLAELGFQQSAVYYQWFRFAVFAGIKPFDVPSKNIIHAW